ncbi:MAG: class I SAM-dependent methyltransferase [Myxococcales bacterium]|nr:class I SAM-dependent methyltransferase [Deltaproteobacteria bacterium]NNE19100.1 class I SAM-dependent methyltransferase [Myxococcales bacterium]
MTDRREHWEQVYSSKAPDKHSWFQLRPEASLALIGTACSSPATRIIDIGGGTSHLVDELLAQGYQNVSVLDLAPSALEATKRRLAAQADRVHWIEADITSAPIQETFDIWHDRAVFHFLTEASDRAAYVHALKKSLEVGGYAIFATFADDGPVRCSGLPVVRYNPSSLLAELGEGFDLVDTRRELHNTPTGHGQSFVYCLFRRSDSPAPPHLQTH